MRIIKTLIRTLILLRLLILQMRHLNIPTLVKHNQWFIRVRPDMIERTLECISINNWTSLVGGWDIRFEWVLGLVILVFIFWWFYLVWGFRIKLVGFLFAEVSGFGVDVREVDVFDGPVKVHGLDFVTVAGLVVDAVHRWMGGWVRNCMLVLLAIPVYVIPEIARDVIVALAHRWFCLRILKFLIDTI